MTCCVVLGVNTTEIWEFKTSTTKVFDYEVNNEQTKHNEIWGYDKFRSDIPYQNKPQIRDFHAIPVLRQHAFSTCDVIFAQHWHYAINNRYMEIALLVSATILLTWYPFDYGMDG